MTDRDVTVTVVLDDRLFAVDCSAVRLPRRPRGFLVATEPIGYTPAQAGGMKIRGDDAILINLNAVVSVEGDVEHLGPFLGGSDG